MIQAAVIQFPGSNCDHDALKALQREPTISVRYHWHEEPIQKKQYQLILVPGGFSFGDYLRAGAIAKISAAAQSLPEAIEAGAHVLGICNGFQILLEARLLPGYLQVNQSLRFVSKLVELKVEAEAFPWLNSTNVNQTLTVPIAHRFGNYQVPKIDLSEVKPVLKYTHNPNGSFKDIAGIYTKMGKGSVMGMMPHPERASFPHLRLSDGARFWKNAAGALS